MNYSYVQVKKMRVMIVWYIENFNNLCMYVYPVYTVPVPFPPVRIRYPLSRFQFPFHLYSILLHRLA